MKFKNVRIGKLSGKIKAEDLIIRAFLAWILSTIIYLIKEKRVFDTAIFASEINIGLFVLVVCCFFVALNLLSLFQVYQKAEQFAAPLLFTVYGMLSMFHKKDFAYWIALTAVLVLVIVWMWNRKGIKLRIKRTITVKAIYALAAVVYLVIAGGTTILRHLLYLTPAYDFGIWTQMFYYMRKTLLPLTTVERAKLMSHFAVHFSPIYYLYLPFYALVPHPLTLQVLQVLTIASGMIPLYLICKKSGFSRLTTAVFGVLFALYPAFATGCYYDLHENCFLVPVLMWMFWAVERRSRLGLVISCVSAVLIKEDAPVYVACIGLYQFLDRKEYRNGIMVMACSVGSFLIVTGLMKIFGEGVMLYRYSNYMLDGNGGLFDVIKTVIVNPAYLIQQCADPEKLKFLLAMLLPLGCLPVITKRPGRFVLLIPLVLVNLASNYGYQYSMFYQYVLGTGVILMYLALVNYRDLSHQAKTQLCTLAVCASLLSMPIYSLERYYHWKEYKHQKEQLALLDEAVEVIPKDASVSASTFLVPHLAERDVIYEYPGWYSRIDMTDYIMIDLRYHTLTEADAQYFEANGYEETDRQEGLYLVLKRGDK